jgi:hypothetical protein
MAVSLVSTGVTFPDSSTQITAATGFGFKNRIINGAMVIDQRNAGASVSAVNGNYYLDRFQTPLTGGGVFTIQRSTTAPVGFTNSAQLTVTTPDTSIASGDYYAINQYIEGFNAADLGWGTANAQAVTLSFWVRSSITGTYCVWINNGTGGRSYVATYTVNSANTWEQKTITVAGDTSGTWPTDNTAWGRVWFTLGGGSLFTTTAGSWQAGALFQTSAQTQWIATNGATFYITGVQLEKGSTATSFDYRPYGTEFALCQRYYEVSSSTPSTAPQANAIFYSGYAANTGIYYVTKSFMVAKRAAPTVTPTLIAVSGFPSAACTIGQPDIMGFRATQTANSTVADSYFINSWIASIEL